MAEHQAIQFSSLHLHSFTESVPTVASLETRLLLTTISFVDFYTNYTTALNYISFDI